MKNYHPSSVDQGVIRSYAHTVKSAGLKLKKDVPDFCKKALVTDIFKNYLEDYTVYSQSPNAIAKMIIKELEEKGILVKNNEIEEYIEIDAEAGYWLGFVIMQWMFKEKNAYDYLVKLDFDSLFEAYDTLHTQDINYAIEFAKEEYLFFNE